MTAAHFRITRVGIEGDGIAEAPDATRRYFPRTLPGELVQPTNGDTLLLERSTERVEPPCGHFGACGGCSLQHWQDDAYAEWKSQLVQAALARAGFQASVPLPHRTPPRSRRRMDLALQRQGSAVIIGLHAPGSARAIDLRECHVLDPALFALIAPIRMLLPTVSAFRREGSAIVNLLDSGPDLLLRLDRPLTAGDRTRLAAFAAAHQIARIAVADRKRAPEVACQLRVPVYSIGEVNITPPPGAFLQASAPGQQAITEAVMAGLPGRLRPRDKIVELFAGCGTFTFPLAQRARVLAFEGETASVAALRAAANAAGLAGRIVPEQRDLCRRPLLAVELTGCATVVLDPPHAGALTQVAELARAAVARIIYVSCNPATLARDARLLHTAGYRLLAATAIDQFLWSARVESVSVFAT